MLLIVTIKLRWNVPKNLIVNCVKGNVHVRYFADTFVKISAVRNAQQSVKLPLTVQYQAHVGTSLNVSVAL